MIPILDSIFIGSSSAAIIGYLLKQIKCIWNNPCSSTDQLCIYANNDAHIIIDENEIIVTANKKTKPLC